MLGLDVRAGRAAWTASMVVLCLLALYRIRGTLFIFFIALLLAYLLAPLVEVADRVRPKRLPRTFTLGAVYILLLALLSAASGFLATQVVGEASQLAAKVPGWLSQNDPRLWRLPPWLEPFRESLAVYLRSQLQNSAKELVPLIQNITHGVLFVLGNFGVLVLVPILSFFLLKDAAHMRGQILEMIGEGNRRAFIEELFSDVHIVLGQYMRALVILAAAASITYGLFFLLFGVPYAALLAGLAGVLEFIPVIGPLTAALIALLITALSGKISLLPWLLLFLAAYRLFQDYLLQPWLLSAGVALHPLGVIFGILAGGQIAGVAGMFLSIPILATLRMVMERHRRRHIREMADSSSASRTERNSGGT